MLISGGKVLAIDKVKHGNTLTGDGAFGELDVNTNVIATVASVSSISSTLDKKIDTASANLSAEIDKKEDKITYHYNAFDKIDKINGSALAGGNNVVLEEGDNIKITPRQDGENVIYNISTPSYTSKDESLLKVDEYSLSAKNWLPEIKESSANAVDVVSANFGDTSNGITGYNGIGLNIPAQKDVVGGKSINVVTGTNDFTINLDTSADVVAYSAGYGLGLANHEFSVEQGFFALSSEVYNKVEVNELLANFGGFVIVEGDLPEPGDVKKIYLKKDESVPGIDKYREWIYSNNTWVCIGDTSIDLTNYATSAWVIQNFLSANALDLIARTSGNWDSVYTTVNTTSSDWNDVSSKLNTNDFNAWSAQADITPYTGVDPIVVKDHKIYLSADYLSANALDEIKEASANWNSVYETVKATSGDWNEVSSKADKTDLDDLSGKVETLSGELKETSSYLNEKIETLSDELESTSSFLSGAIDVVSAEFEKVIYTSASAGWDVTPYSAGQNINITNHTISSKDWLPEIKEASANAVDVVEGRFDTTENEEFSGYNGTPFYVKQMAVTGESPIIVTKDEDKYNIEFEDEYKKFIEEVSAKLYTSALPTVESLTPDYLKVELVDNQDGTSAWQLSASEQKNYQAGDYIDIDENDKINVTGLHNVTLSSTDESIGITATTGVNGDVNYNLSVDQIKIPDISGYNGIDARFNQEKGQYEVGIENYNDIGFAKFSTSANVFTTSAVANGYNEDLNVNPTKITLDNDQILLKTGFYHIDVQTNFNVTTADNNYYDVLVKSIPNAASITQMIDASYEHYETVDLSFDVRITEDDTPIKISVENYKTNETFTITNLNIHEIVSMPSQIEGGAGNYQAGKGIIISNDTIEARLGDGLEFNGNDIQVKLGKGLKFDDSQGVQAVTIDSDVNDVVEAVQELQEALDTKITDNYPPAMITIADLQVASNTQYAPSNGGMLIGYLFTCPITHKIYNGSTGDYQTKIGIYTKQWGTGQDNFQFNRVILGIYEYQPDYVNPNTHQVGKTEALCDTGIIELQQGYAEYDIKNLGVATTHEMKPGCFYYAAIYMSYGQVDTNGLTLFGAPGYNTQVNNLKPGITITNVNCIRAALYDNMAGYDPDLNFDKMGFSWEYNSYPPTSTTDTTSQGIVEAHAAGRPYFAFRNVKIATGN